MNKVNRRDADFRGCREVGEAARAYSVGGTPGCAEPRLEEGDFPGCKAIPMNLAEYMEYEEKVEYWDGDAKIGWVVEAPVSTTHENPGACLPALAAVIASVRGSEIKCRGSADLIVRDEQGTRHKVMRADQMSFLHPRRAKSSGKGVEIGRDTLPDVMLEVDHTTDVRRRKLGLYESWGFPELWVEVPDDGYAVNRPAGLKPGLTIYLLENGVYQKSSVSRAFPGWTAAEIHRALNEREMSQETHDVLARVGAALGRREGTGPDHTPWLRKQREDAKRTLLLQLAEKRFGAPTAKRLSALLNALLKAKRGRGSGILADVADRIIDCETGAEFIAAVEALARRNGMD